MAVAFPEDIWPYLFHFHIDGIGRGLKNSLESREEIIKIGCSDNAGDSKTVKPAVCFC
jgi:hypothetical protein